MVPPDAEVPPLDPTLPPVGLAVAPPVEVPPLAPSDDEHPTQIVETARKYPRDSLCMVKAFSPSTIPRSVPVGEGIQLNTYGKFA
jgi:hypothetical protein